MNAYTQAYTQTETPAPAAAAAFAKAASDEARALAASSEALFLGPEWYPAFVDLNKKVRDALPMGQKYFLREQTLQTLHTRTGPVMGVITPCKRLIGGALLTYPHLHEDTSIVDDFENETKTLDAVFQCVMVDPKFSGAGLFHKLIGLGEYAMHGEGLCIGKAKIAFNNQNSQQKFGQAGFKKGAKLYRDTSNQNQPYWYNLWTRTFTP